MTELQIFNLSRYVISLHRFYHGKDYTYDKETMLHIHTHLMTHPTKNTFFISDFTYERMQVLQQCCEDYLNNNVFIKIACWSMGGPHEIRSTILYKLNCLLMFIFLKNMHFH